ncbi:MAG: hypothetical protein PHN74_01420 [Candidatus Pacebacteria bacterium]|nr:hypothetical protein [Candidatus Paceibacterota bacterium]
MAIIVEEKKTIKWGNVLTVVVIAVVVLASAYFLFFSAKPGVEVTVPQKQKLATELSKISIDSSSVLNSDSFKVLKRYSSAPAEASIGKTNPFAR